MDPPTGTGSAEREPVVWSIASPAAPERIGALKAMRNFDGTRVPRAWAGLWGKVLATIGDPHLGAVFFSLIGTVRPRVGRPLEATGRSSRPRLGPNGSIKSFEDRSKKDVLVF